MTDVETLLRTHLHDRLDGLESSSFTASSALRAGHRARRRRTALVAVAASAALIGAGAVATTATRTHDAHDTIVPATDLQARTASYAEQFRDGDFATIRADMTAPVRELLPEVLLRSGWRQIVDGLGPLTRIDPAARDPRTAHTYVLPLHFRRGDDEMRVTYDDDGRVIGVRILPRGTDQDPDVSVALAQAPGVVDDLAAERYDEVWARFDATMRRKLPVNQLREDWRSVAVKTHGGFVSAGGHSVRTVAGATVVDIYCQMRRGELKVRIAFDAHGDISGLFFLAP